MKNILYPLSLRENKALQLIALGKKNQAKNHYKAVLKQDLRIASLCGIIKLEIEDQNINAAINYISVTRLKYEKFKDHVWVNRSLEEIGVLLEAKTKKIRKKISLSEKESIRVAVISAAWKRPNLTEIFLSHLERMFKAVDKYKLDYRCFISVSEDLWKSRLMAERYEYCSFVSAENNPLSQKWQRGLSEAKKWRPDLILIMGSDNFISSNRLERMIQSLDDDPNCHMIGLKDCAIVDKEEVIKWKGYGIFNQPHRTGEPIGAGRIITSELLEELSWNLWGDAEKNKGLDALVMDKLEKIGYVYANLDGIYELQNKNFNLIKILESADFFDTVLDVKTSVNVTKVEKEVDRENYDSWQGSVDEFLLKITGSNVTADEIRTYLRNGVE